MFTLSYVFTHNDVIISSLLKENVVVNKEEVIPLAVRIFF